DKYQVGLISFGSHAVLTVPPTTDRAAVRAGLASLHTGDGTALGDAVVLGVKLAHRQRTKDGVVPPTSMLVISDGAQEGGRTTSQAAARQARAAHIPVSSIVLGTPGGIVTQKLVGGYTQQIRVPPSPATLQKMAQTTGGQVATAGSAAKLHDVYSKL